MHALLAFDDGTGPAPYIAGGFTTAGGLQANRIGRWNASGWSTLQGGMDGGVWTLVALGDALYAGGHFGTAGGTAANRIARWSGLAASAAEAGAQWASREQRERERGVAVWEPGPEARSADSVREVYTLDCRQADCRVLDEHASSRLQRICLR